MEQCLIDNKVCSEQNRKCKECKLDDCRKAIKMIEEEQKWIDRDNLRKLKKDLPEQCRSCSFLEIINLEREEVYCPYMLKNCILHRSFQQYCG